MFRTLLICACLIGLLAGCDSPDPVDAKPLLVINEEQVFKADFLQAFQRTLHPDQQLSEIVRIWHAARGIPQF